MAPHQLLHLQGSPRGSPNDDPHGKSRSVFFFDYPPVSHHLRPFQQENCMMLQTPADRWCVLAPRCPLSFRDSSSAPYLLQSWVNSPEFRCRLSLGKTPDVSSWPFIQPFLFSFPERVFSSRIHSVNKITFDKNTKSSVLRIVLQKA